MTTVRVTLPLYNLGCSGGEALAIERVIAKMPGVTQVYLNPLTEMAYVVYDPALVGQQHLRAALDRLGYGAPRPAVQRGIHGHDRAAGRALMAPVWPGDCGWTGTSNDLYPLACGGAAVPVVISDRSPLGNAAARGALGHALDAAAWTGRDVPRRRYRRVALGEAFPHDSLPRCRLVMAVAPDATAQPDLRADSAGTQQRVSQ